MDGRVSAARSTDRPRASDIAFFRGYAIVTPFAEVVADRVDRRKVQNIEAHRCDSGKLPLHVAESSVRTGLRRCRPRKELIPRAECGDLPVNLDRIFARMRADELPLGVPPHQREKVFAPDVLDLFFDRIFRLQRVDESFEFATVTSIRAGCGGTDHLEADQDLDLEILPGDSPINALLEVAVPGQEMIDPSLDREVIEAEFLHCELCRPAIVDERE